MSIQEAIVNATKDILSSYLAPELVEQLSDDIMQRAAPDIEAALTTFAGFEVGKGSGLRAKGAGIMAPRKPTPRGGRRRKDSGESEAPDDGPRHPSRSPRVETPEPANADMA